MTRSERRLLVRTVLLGAVLTVGVCILDGLGSLEPLERPLYDLRARRCQFFTPPSTDRLVHLDIDDATLEEIGAFPWPREKLAEMTDEIRLAGAKVIAFDILFSEPQVTRYRRREDGSFQEISDDQLFASAIGRAGNVLLPVSVDPRTTKRSPELSAMVVALSSDLELTEADLVAKLRGGPLDRPDLPVAVHEAFVRARDVAAFDRIRDLMDQGIDDLPTLTQRLTPRADAAQQNTDARLTLERVYSKAHSVRIVLQRSGLTPPGLPPLIEADEENAVSLPVLSEPAKYSASAVFLPDKDGVVRRVPLFINYRGHLMPHMALVTACALLGVDLRQVHCTADAVILPLPNAGEISIPVSTLHSDEYGKAGLFMNVPWIGTRDWLTMYDAPAYAQPKQHVPLKTVWAICQNHHDIEHNAELADNALLFAAKEYPAMEKAAALVAKPAAQRTADERWEAIADTLDQMGSLADIPALEKIKTAELSDLDQRYLATFHALQQIKSRNDFLSAEAQRGRKSLKEALTGRAVLVGWAATGHTDNWTTSLHAQCPGPVIQGVIFNGILTGNLWHTAPSWVNLLLTAVVGMLITIVVALLSPKKAMFMTVLVMITYFSINGVVLFAQYKLVVGAAAPLVTAAACWSSLTLVRYIAEATERARIERRFRSYVDPELVNYVKEHPESVHIQGQVKEMTVVFTDLQGFTAISERLRERTVPMLNEYMNLMLPVIRENRGYWNKFLGDGIMFFFNAPTDNPHHARDAIATVLQMQKAMGDFNRRLLQSDLPQCTMRAGVSSGPMVVGDAGATQGVHRASDYTVLGDDVNLGARLESANKALGSKILMNLKTAELCGDEFLLRPMGKLRVVGKTEGIMTFEALCRADEATDDQRKLAEFSRSVVDRYRAAAFRECIDCAREMENCFGSTKFSKLYIDLCNGYIAAPPEGAFDGQIILGEK